MTEFINAFKKTSYYQGLFSSSEMLLIYVAGSRCSNITDERSDYDIVVVTLDGNYEDASEYEYLMYKGKKVHYYYRPIKHFFDAKHGDIKACNGTVLFRNINKELVLYENPKYNNILRKLYEIKNKLSDLGLYHLYEMRKGYINNVINEGQILEKHYTKYLYYLCLASYYLSGEEPDKEFLRILKRIRWQPVPDEYKQLAVERLKLYKNYIESHPIDLYNAFKDLYKELDMGID